MPRSTLIPSPKASADHLLNAAKLLFAQKGYHGVSVKEISEKADVNVALINYYFNSKENLYRTLVEQYGNQQLAISQNVLVAPTSFEDYKNQLTEFLTQKLDRMAQDPDLARMILRDVEFFENLCDDVFRSIYLQMHDKFLEFLSEAKRRGFLRGEIEPRQAAFFFFAQIATFIRCGHLPNALFETDFLNQDHRSQWINHTIGIFLSGSAPNSITLD